MSTFLTILRIIVQLLPTIVELVKTIESVAPMPGAGTKKLDLITGAVTDIYTATPAITKEIQLPVLIDIIVKIVARVVSLFNDLGVFQKPPQ